LTVSSRYQVVWIDPARTGQRERVEETLRRRVQELGLDPAQEVVFLDEQGLAQLDARAPIAAVYFGGKAASDEATAAIERLRRLAAFVLPVVPTLRRYTSLVPEGLHAVSGFAAADDAALEGVAGQVLEELGLVRGKRRVFLGYRRDKSSKVAEQLYHALDARGFDVFLDTHSAPAGTLFESALWERMSDTDVLVLLDAPGTLDSRGMAEQLARAAQLGVGVLQLLWPEHARAVETELCETEYLDEEDFQRGDANLKGGLPLRHLGLQRVAMTVEALRARTMAARRSRLVGELCRAAERAGMSAAVQPEGHVDMVRRGQTLRVRPVVGYPDAVAAEDVFEASRKPPVAAFVLYDPAWMPERRARHVEWLNKQLPDTVRLLRTTEIDAWVRAR